MCKEIDLTSYPLLSRKEAGEEVTRLRKSLELGYDPKVIRRLERQAIIAADLIWMLKRQNTFVFAITVLVSPYLDCAKTSNL